MQKKWLVIILVLAAFFRFFHLTLSPPALNWDEVSIGYNAYSILKTGRDEWSVPFPLSFKAFGEQKLPGMIYASIPGIALFGETDFGVRVTPAVIGLIAVYLTYLLARQLLKKENLALTAAFLMAISPWAIHFSRVSFEAGLAMVFMLASLIYLVKAKESPRSFWGAMIFALLAAYTYNSVRILLPLLFITYLMIGVIKVTRQNAKIVCAAILVGIVLSLPILFELRDPAGRVRWGTVSLASQKSFSDNIAESRGYTTLPGILPRLIHNKVTHYVYALGSNYIHVFSTEFLFLDGGDNSQRSVQGMGLLYLFELPLLVIGLIRLYQKNSGGTVAKQVLLPWLLLAPIPSILTIDSPSTVRALGLLPALILVEALGASVIFSYLRTRRIIRALCLLFVFWNVGYFCYLLFFVYPVKYSDKWLYGYKEAIQFAQSHYAQASQIYLPAKYGEPYIYTLFYTGYDPHKFQNDQVQRGVDPLGWVHNSGFDKYHFSDYSGLEVPSEIVARNQGTIVIVTGFAELPGEWNRIMTIRAPNWKVMFEGTIQEGKQ